MRFIAVNDGVDSEREDNDFTPLRNTINEWYEQDTSKKIRAVFRAKGMSGKRLSTQALYGYLWDSEGNLTTDPETASVVKLIFQLTAEGNGPGKIARRLREMEIVTLGTMEFERTGRTRRYDPENPCFWLSSTIVHILNNRDYLGHTVNFKTTRKSYKCKKTVQNPEEKQIVFENTHEVLVSQEMWEIVQKNRENRRRPTRMGDMGLFSGLLYCADCGHTLNLDRTKSWAREQGNYTCGTYKRKKGECTAHFIRAMVLEQLVLENLRGVIAFAREDTEGFIRQAMSNRMAAQMQEQAKRMLEQQERRITEIDSIIKWLYEDNISGKLTDEHFSQMSTDYEREQAGLQVSVEELRESVAACEQQSVNMEQLFEAGEEVHRAGQAVPRNANILMNTLQRISAFCISAQSHGRFKKYPGQKYISHIFCQTNICEKIICME